MTPQRYLLAMIFFHATVLAIAWVVVARWRHPERCRLDVVPTIAS